ncbi:MAG: acyl-CoA dehydrogenase family protein [Rhodospirillales bacterium]|nr:acyl-CoA dehydrogenase family protein [Rhodospirillales bacterium]
MTEAFHKDAIVFPKDKMAKREFLLNAVADVSETIRASSEISEELGTLAPEAVKALRGAGLFRLKMPMELGGAEADPVTEMLVLEELAYQDFTSGWCTMVGATSAASLGAFLPQSGIDKVFIDGHVPTASISFFPAGLAKKTDGGFTLNGRWRFNSGIGHAEWAIGGAVVDGTQNGDGPPQTMFCAVPIEDVTLHHNWDDVVGLKGTGSIDYSVEDYFIPDDLTFVWDMDKPQSERGGEAFYLPPLCYVAKEHGSVAIGAGRRVLDELIHLATSTRGTFRASSLDERQIVHRVIGEADLKLRSARALLHQSYTELEAKTLDGWRPDAAAVTEGRSMAVFCTDIAIDIASKAYHFAGNTALHQPHTIERIFRDLHTAGLHQVISDTSYENQGKILLGLPIDPAA